MQTKNFFIYPGTQPFVVNANSRNTDSIVLNDRYNFFAYYITFKAFISAVPPVTANNNILLQIRVGSQNFFNLPVRLDLIAGDGANSNFLPVRLMFRKRDNVSLDYQNTDPANNIAIFMAFVGYEITGV